MSYVYAVTITDTKREKSEVARVFTRREDADTFIATCREVDDRDCWTYDYYKIELDGDPKGTF